MDFSNVTSFISNITNFGQTKEKKQTAEADNPLAHAAENVKNQEPKTQVTSAQIGTSKGANSEITNNQQTMLEAVLTTTSTMRDFIAKSIDQIIEFDFAIPGFGREKIEELGTVKPIKMETQTLNQEIININLIKLIEIVGKEKNLTDFRTVIKEMIEGGHKAEAAKCIELLLEKFESSASTHHASGVRFKPREGFDRNSYNNLTAYLSLTFKNFRNYFNTIGGEAGIDKSGLSDNGVAHILGRLSGEGKLNDVKCICCTGTDAAAKAWSGPYEKDPQSLTFQIRGQIDQMKQVQGPARCTFVVSQHSHFTPIFLEKSADGKFHIIVTDSTGNNKEYIPNILADIKDALKESKVSNKSDIYVYDQQRQCDQSNCGVFAIHDIVKMSKNADTLFSWIADNGKVKKGAEGNVHNFSVLPPTMMKTATKSTVEKYPTLTAFLQKHTVTALVDIRDKESLRIVDVKSKDFNAKVSKAYLKYERQLMTQLMLDGNFDF